MPAESTPRLRPVAGPVDEFVARFEAGWQAGRPEPAERLLAAAPEPAREALLRRLLAAERAHRADDNPLTAAEAAERFSPLGPWAAAAVAEAFAGDPAVVLELLSGPAAGRVFRLTGHGMFTVGRVSGFHVSLPQDPYLSRAHCLIEFRPPAARLVDLDSKGGTWVNGTRVAIHDLADGDTVRAGSTVFRVGLAGGTRPPDVLFPAGPDPALPALPGYDLEAEIGRGSMGVVYKARRAGRPVAVKVIRPGGGAVSREAAARFRREAAVVGRLDHPNVVRFVDAGEAAGLLYFAMEFVPGTDAAKVVEREGPVAPARAGRWAAQLLDALAHAHDAGFVHRDVKPANLLVVPGPGGEAVKLTDFGLARAYDASHMSWVTMSGVPGGTPLFMPPEQAVDFRGVGPAADQYAAAATLFYVLTGRPVYAPGSMSRVLYQVLTAPPEPLRREARAVPGGFGPVLRRALARDPADRFPDVRAMRAALPPAE